MNIFKSIQLWFLQWRNKEVYKYELDLEMLEIMLKGLNCDVEITDNSKMVCDLDMLKKLAKLIPAKYLKYKSEEYDCDKFSRIAWGIWAITFPRLAIGYCHLDKLEGKHAMNCAIYKSGNTYGFAFIEPQTGEVYVLGDYPGRPYKIIF